MMANQHYFIQEVQPIRYQRKLCGLNVFYAPNPHVPGMQLVIDTDNELLARHGKEYMEAVMADAAQFAATADLRHNTVALINRREIAIVIDRREKRAYVMPLSRFRPRLDARVNKELDEWFQKAQFGYFAVPLEGFKP